MQIVSHRIRADEIPRLSTPNKIYIKYVMVIMINYIKYIIIINKLSVRVSL